MPSTQEINEDRKNIELDNLRIRLRTLAVTSPEDIFRELNVIRAEYDARAAAVEERLVLIEENLPTIVQQCTAKRAQLRSIKTDVLSDVAAYKLHVKKVHDLASQHCPDVIDRLSSINENMARIEQLKCEEKAGELISGCLLSLTKDDASEVMCALQAAIAHKERMRRISTPSILAYEERLSAVASSVNAWTDKRLKQVLESIMWPWSDAKDERAYAVEVQKLMAITTAYYLALTLNADDGCFDERTESAADRLTAAVFDRVAIRFRFHFYGSRKTADPLHPEWFLSQLILWMRHSLVLFTMILQPVLDQNKVRSSCHDSFIRHCCELGKEKAKSLLESENYRVDVTLFSTLIDELIAFEEQREDWDQCPGEFSILQVLCEEEVRKRWLMVENIACEARVDDILSSTSRWNHRFVEAFSDVDPLLVCEAADSFVTLLLCLRLRAKRLPCPVTRKMFVDLQVMLIDDFRSRLVQVANGAESPWETPFTQIMNAMWYMEKSIEEWGELELVTVVEGEDERGQIRGRLVESVKMYNHVWEQMASDVVGSFRSQVKAFAQNYASQNWRGVSRMRSGDREISATFCPLLLRVRSALTDTVEKLCAPAIGLMFRRMLSAVAEILMEHVITLVHFNAEGADQMCFDVSVGLVSVVGAVLQRTEAVNFKVEHEKAMVKVLSCLRVLSLSVPNAMLLQEELNASGDDEAEEKLMAMKVHLIGKELALSLLKRRSDIKLENGGGPIKFGL